MTPVHHRWMIPRGFAQCPQARQQDWSIWKKQDPICQTFLYGIISRHIKNSRGPFNKSNSLLKFKKLALQTPSNSLNFFLPSLSFPLEDALAENSNSAEL
jgi:hypothetical protein